MFKFNVNILFLLILPIIIISIFPNLLFGMGPDAFDSLYSLSAILFKHIQQYTPIRQFERIPVLFPGWLLFITFKPILAHILFILLCFYSIIFPFYFILKSLSQSEIKATLATIILIIFNSNFLNTLGDYYITLPILSYTALSLLFIHFASINKSNKLLLLSGFFWSATFCSHTMLIANIILIPSYYIIFNFNKKSILKLFKPMFIWILGAGICYLTCCLINVIIFRQAFAFYKMNLKMSQVNVFMNYLSFKEILFLPTTIFIILSLLISILYLLKNKSFNNNISKLSVWFLISMSSYLLLSILVGYIRPGSNVFRLTLSHIYYRPWPFLFAIIPLGAILIPSFNYSKTKNILLLFSISLIYFFLFYITQTLNPNYQLIFLFIIFFLSVIYYFSSNKYVPFAAMLLFISQIHTHLPTEIFTEKPIRANIYIRFYDGINYMKTIINNTTIRKPYFFWFDNNRLEAFAFQPILTPWIWDRFHYAEDFPKFNFDRDLNLKKIILTPTSTIIIFTEKPDAMSLAQIELSKYKLKFIKVDEFRNLNNNYGYTIIVGKLENL